MNNMVISLFVQLQRSIPAIPTLKVNSILKFFLAIFVSMTAYREHLKGITKTWSHMADDGATDPQRVETPWALIRYKDVILPV